MMKAWRPRPVGHSGNPTLISGLVAFLWLPLLSLAQLNDTGVDKYSDDSSYTPLEPPGFPGQDPSYGRDADWAAGRLPKVGGGIKGFDFTKMANDGSELPKEAKLGSEPKDWACTRDNVTGLEWEVKTDNNSLRDKDWYYSWYSIDNSSNGGKPGTETPLGNPGVCGNTLTHCNTREYAYAVNQAGLCGHADWRLPTREELRSIVDYGFFDRETIDLDYFPNTAIDWFWSSSVYAGDPNHAWYFHFGDAFDGHYSKNYSHRVRLVRGPVFPPPQGEGEGQDTL